MLEAEDPAGTAQVLTQPRDARSRKSSGYHFRKWLPIWLLRVLVACNQPQRAHWRRATRQGPPGSWWPSCPQRVPDPTFPPPRVPRVPSPGPGSPRFRLRWFPAFPPQGRLPRVPSPGPASLPALLPRAAQHAGAGMGGPDAARCGPETQLRFPWAASCFRERPSLSVNSALLTTRFPP